MFQDFRERHPVVFWVLVIGGGLILVWALLGRAGGGSVSTVSAPSGPSDAQVASAAAIQTAQIQAASDAAARADNLALAEETLAVQFHVSKMENDRGVAADGLNYQLGIANINAQTAQVGIAADVQKMLAKLDSDTQIAQINANRDTSLAVTNAQVSINSANNKTERKKSSNGLIGNIIGGIASIFCDERLKQDIWFEFVDAKTGLNWYSFTYTDDARRRFGLPGERRIGVLAHELIDTQYAHALTRDHTGYLRVNYGAINGVAHGRLALA